MKVFISALDSGVSRAVIEELSPMKWNLLSYYYIRNKRELFEAIRSGSEEILIDSGAHSFQKGAKVKWVEYTEQYASWIKSVDSDKILGYFEMDVDNVIGYEAVLSLRKTLQNVTDKIIPVWHKNRGISEYLRMCDEYAGKIIAVTGF